MDKYVAWLPSPGQRFSEKKFLFCSFGAAPKMERYRFMRRLENTKTRLGGGSSAQISTTPKS